MKSGQNNMENKLDDYILVMKALVYTNKKVTYEIKQVTDEIKKYNVELKKKLNKHDSDLENIKNFSNKF